MNAMTGHMNSFTLFAVGNLARPPERVAEGDTVFARFCLVGNDYIPTDDPNVDKCVASSIWFNAFNHIALDLLENANKGDQLIVEALVSSIDRIDKTGEKYGATTFIVTGFRYGAKKRGGDSGPSVARRRRPDAPPQTDEMTEAVAA